MSLLSTFLGFTTEQAEPESYVRVRLGDWVDVEVKSGEPFSGEMLEKGARISDGVHDFEIHRFSKVDGDVIAESKHGALINVTRDLKEVHWSHLSLSDLLEVEKSKFTDEQIADAISKVKDTPEYKAVLDTGARFTSSKIQVKRGVLRFLYDNRLSYLIFPTGKIRGQRNNTRSSAQTLYKRNVVLTDDLLENYKRMLKRVHQIIGRREGMRKNQSERDAMLDKPARRLGDLNLPSPYPASLEISKRHDIETLDGGPSSVKGDFKLYFLHNLVSLEGGPKSCKFFSIHMCPKLETLRGGPRKCGYFSVDGAPLKDLEGAPECDGMNLHNIPKLESLKGMQKNFKHGVSVYNTDARVELSLEGVGRDFLLSCANLTIKVKRATHVLGLVFVKVASAKYAQLDFPGGDIMKQHLGTGSDGLIDAQHELISAGLEDIAKL